MKQRRNIEIAGQRELLKYIKLTYPQLEVVWVRNEGDKALISAVLDEMSGLVAGFPDLIIFATIGEWTHLLHLELKKIKGTLSGSQKDWHADFIPTTNRTLATAYGYLHAREIVDAWVARISQFEE